MSDIDSEIKNLNERKWPANAVAEIERLRSELDELRLWAKEQPDFLANEVRLKNERDAYKKAKEENDERFMIERDEARADLYQMRAERDEARAECKEAALAVLSAHRISSDHKDKNQKLETEITMLKRELHLLYDSDLGKQRKQIVALEFEVEQLRDKLLKLGVSDA